jgi:hypothetical protein
MSGLVERLGRSARRAPTLLTCGTKTASPLAGGGCQCNTGICGGSVTITVRNQQGGGRC